jgi:DNA-binding CsgD family transcriptional regulator
MVIDLIGALRAREQTSDDVLTARESEILLMLRSGQTTAEIASVLRISPITVRRHISKLLRKAGASGRSELLKCALS